MTVPRSRGRKSGINEPYRYNEVGSYHLSKHHLRKDARRSRREARRAKKSTVNRVSAKNRYSGYRRETIDVQWHQPVAKHQGVLHTHIWKNSADGRVVWSNEEPHPVQLTRWVSVAERATWVKPVSQKMGVGVIED